MLQNYKEDSIHKINQWLNEATRFKDNKLIIENYEEFILDFQASATYEIKASHYTMTYSGRANIGYMCGSYGEYISSIKEVESREENNKDTLNYLYDLVQKNDFGFIKSSFKLKDSMKFAYTDTCTSCHNGETTCFSCAGRGRDSCNFCAGLGNISKTRQATGFDGSSYTESYMERCVHCHGRGYNECSSCGGRGYVRCSVCDGSGIKTEVASISVYAIPYYDLKLQEEIDSKVEDVLYKILLYNLGKYAKLEFIESNIEFMDSVQKECVYEIHDVSMPIAKILSDFNGEKIEWIVYGRTYEIGDAGGILDLLLQSDLFVLKKRAFLSFLNPFISFYSKKSIINFMQSSINETLFKTDSIFGNVGIKAALNGRSEYVKNVEFKRLPLNIRAQRDFELLNNTISESYIKTALKSMYKLTKSICFYSNIKWFIFAFVLSFGFLCYKIPYIYATQSTKGAKSSVYTYKNADRIYLNKSYLNAKKGFNLGIYFSTIGDAFRFYVLLFFILSSVAAFWYRKMWFKFRGKSLYLWLDRYDINQCRYFLFPICGILLCALLLYFIPIYIDKDSMIYGILPLRYIT